MDCKRILLVHPLGYDATKAENDISRKANLMPPLGIASIAAYLDSKGFISDIIDCYAIPDSDLKIVDYVNTHQPEIVGFSCTTSSIFDGVRIAEIVKKTNPQIKIVFGGVHVSATKEKSLEQFPVIDYCVVGEGEETLAELMAGLEIETIKGIVYSRQGVPFFTGFRKGIANLDDLPFPAYDKLVDYPKAYSLPIFNYPSGANASCISSRGCPYACSYCDRSVFRRSFRYNSAGYLFAHLKHLNENFGIKHINFYDDQFTFNRERVVEFCEKVIASPLKMTFNCAARAEHLDEELLHLMKKAGCWMISLGIETGDQQLLAMHRQNPDLEMMRDKIALIKKANIRIKGLLMMGLPGETEASIKRSMDYVYSLKLDEFNLAKFTPFPGSPVYDDIKSSKYLGEFEEDWRKMDCMQFLFVPAGLEKDRMEELFIEFYKGHFKQFRTIWNYVTMLWLSPDSWKRFACNIFSFLKFARTNKRGN